MKTAMLATFTSDVVVDVVVLEEKPLFLSISSQKRGQKKMDLNCFPLYFSRLGNICLLNF